MRRHGLSASIKTLNAESLGQRRQRRISRSTDVLQFKKQEEPGRVGARMLGSGHQHKGALNRNSWKR